MKLEILKQYWYSSISKVYNTQYMAWWKFRDFLIPFATVALILIASAAVIGYGRGYRINFKKTSLTPTGLLSVTSDPVGSQVYVEGKLKTATNNSINLEPNWYTIRMTKEGYLPWEKKLRVQGEVVSRADAYLFPTNPSLSPLTTIGIESPVLSTDGTKIAYRVPARHLDGASKKEGLWVYELAEGPLGRNRDPQQVATPDPMFDFTTATITWSPDSTQLLVIAKSGAAKLYRTGRLDNFQDASITYRQTLKEWLEEATTRERQKLAGFSQPIIDIATTSAKIVAFSPDETKILYEATASATIPTVIDPPLLGVNATPETRTIEPGKLYVYDSHEDKNFFVLNKNEVFPGGISWHPTNRHLILALQGKIDVMEYDRTNWITVYSGPFMERFVAPWPNGSRLVVLTNLNATATNLPNLYTVNLR
ncbi:MAG: Protein kinase [Candidatus Gottesmanbacteria bacterium GW2011_GWA2_47_9]|uniref:Protein kinase n=1 Tax=Candidatus Gottesmanbacteria bacterium GW2011_GWA2_47_9 TaxID=1618445 RepID=A0A0G1U0P9_9BACT|nr:MAG: Protein kinase [Candidatus Gottesmanbacteria bacterium GW2011_GWA2_47_9]